MNRLPGLCWTCDRPLLEVKQPTRMSPPESACAICDGGMDPRMFDDHDDYPADRFDREYLRLRGGGWDD